MSHASAEAGARPARRALKIVAAMGGVLVIALVALVVVVQLTWRRDFGEVALPDVKASTDAAVIARGEYVAQHVAHCSHCHSPSAPQLGDLSGGPLIDAGPFGRYAPPNLTPDDTGIGRLTDAQVARAIRHAVAHDGALAPMMLIGGAPMSDADLVAVVSYLRALPPRRRETPKDEWGFLAKALAGRFAPRVAVAPPDAWGEGPSVARGAYLVNGPAMCVQCHTARDPMKGFALVGAPLAGDPHPHVDKADPAFEIVAPNITTGGVIGAWTEEQFITRLRAGRALAGSIMPWEAFAGLSDDDARSIFRYLKTQPASAHDVGATRRARR